MVGSVQRLSLRKVPTTTTILSGALLAAIVAGGVCLYQKRKARRSQD